MHGKGTDVGRAGRETGTNNQWPGSEQLLLSTWGTLSFSTSPVTPHGRSPRGKVSWGCGGARTFRHRALPLPRDPILLAREGAGTPAQASWPQPRGGKHQNRPASPGPDMPNQTGHSSATPARGHPPPSSSCGLATEQQGEGTAWTSHWGCAKSSLPKNTPGTVQPRMHFGRSPEPQLFPLSCHRAAMPLGCSGIKFSFHVWAEEPGALCLRPGCTPAPGLSLQPPREAPDTTSFCGKASGKQRRQRAPSPVCSHVASVSALAPGKAGSGAWDAEGAQDSNKTQITQ